MKDLPGWFWLMMIVWGLLSAVAYLNGEGDKWREAEAAQRRLDTFANDLGYEDYDGLKRDAERNGVSLDDR
jgi:hypothetical protein